jgi:YD repeat-containing protein
MIPIPKHFKKPVAVLLLLGSCYPTARACGDLRIPTTHFEGVNEEGFVSRWSQLGALDLGDIQVPVITGFQTYKTYISPELGSGWILPLLDANIVQKDEKSFEMVQPDGWRVHFWRDGQNPNILHGSNLALAEIQGDTITVNSTCGSGWKMVFTQGKITSLSKGNHTLTIQRDGMGRGVAVRDGITPVMTLEQDQVTGLAKSIQIGDQKYQLGYDGKPRVENIGGQNLVGGVEPSLHEISNPDGKKETYDFAVTEKMLPELKITDAQGKERMIVWGLDGRMLQDGEWSYKISPSKEAGANAAIERANQQSQKEYWFKDDPNGRETTVALDGTKTERSWFTSGVLAGKTRKEIIIGSNKIINQNSWKYDENGTLIRSNQDGIATDYDAIGRQIKISQNGRALNYTYDSEGFITAINKTKTQIP